jgi:DNA-binding response OmpR family regulator
VRILIVDDEPDVVLLCRVNLEHAGHEIAEATDGTDALERAIAWRPALIVLDVMLPGMDGFTVLERLRAHEGLREVPVILLTAKTQLADQLRGYRAGANAYLTKPFSPADLTGTVERLRRMSPQERARHRRDRLVALTGGGA